MQKMFSIPEAGCRGFSYDNKIGVKVEADFKTVEIGLRFKTTDNKFEKTHLFNLRQAKLLSASLSIQYDKRLSMNKTATVSIPLLAENGEKPKRQLEIKQQIVDVDGRGIKAMLIYIGDQGLYTEAAYSLANMLDAVIELLKTDSSKQ